MRGTPIRSTLSQYPAMIFLCPPERRGPWSPRMASCSRRQCIQPSSNGTTSRPEGWACVSRLGGRATPGLPGVANPAEPKRKRGPIGPLFVPGVWQEREDSNPRPLVLETSALARLSYAPRKVVPLEGLEPPTRDLGRRRSIQLSYRGTLVEIGGLEPPTSALRTPRSPS